MLCRFDVVVHFAGRKAVGESVAEPMLYYTHNMMGTINLIEAMRKHNCKNVSVLCCGRCRLSQHMSACLAAGHLPNWLTAGLSLPCGVQMVFSSSCTVYGDVKQEHVPIKESTPLAAMSPYGRTKLMIEDMFRDVAASDKEWRIILLRYFNPVGAHPSGAPHCQMHVDGQVSTHRVLTTRNCKGLVAAMSSTCGKPSRLPASTVFVGRRVCCPWQ